VPIESQLTPPFGGGSRRTPSFGILSTYPRPRAGWRRSARLLQTGWWQTVPEVSIVRVADGRPSSSKRVIGELVNGSPRSVVGELGTAQ